MQKTTKKPKVWHSPSLKITLAKVEEKWTKNWQKTRIYGAVNEKRSWRRWKSKKKPLRDGRSQKKKGLGDGGSQKFLGSCL